jgi:hypothetical protein
VEPVDEKPDVPENDTLTDPLIVTESIPELNPTEQPVENVEKLGPDIPEIPKEAEVGESTQETCEVEFVNDFEPPMYVVSEDVYMENGGIENFLGLEVGAEAELEDGEYSYDDNEVPCMIPSKVCSLVSCSPFPLIPPFNFTFFIQGPFRRIGNSIWQGVHIDKNVDAFFCTECGYSSLNREDLVRHELTHNEPIKCDHCTRTFTRRDHLRSHERRMHKLE